MAGTLVANTINTDTGVFSTVNAYGGMAKAIVWWDGYNSPNNTIYMSYNVSSVTYNGTGNWTVNFTNSFSDAYYVSLGGCAKSDSGNDGGESIQMGGYQGGLQTASSCPVRSTYLNGTARNTQCWAAFFHN